MKKKDIKQDPIRDAFLSFVTKIKENKQYSFPILGILVIGLPLLIFTLSNREVEEDYVECSSSSGSDNSLIVDAYCKALKLGADSYDFSNRDKVIDSRLHEKRGRDLANERKWDKSLEEYLKALELYPYKKGDHLAQLNYNISSCYFEKKDFDNSSLYLEKAILEVGSENKSDNSLYTRIQTLKGELKHLGKTN